MRQFERLFYAIKKIRPIFLPKISIRKGWPFFADFRYVYDAAGTKLSKQKTDAYTNVTTKYAGNYVYEDRTTIVYGGTVNSSELQFFNHAEGYVQNNNGIFTYVYKYKDHLGNVRLS